MSLIKKMEAAAGKPANNWDKYITLATAIEIFRQHEAEKPVEMPESGGKAGVACEYLRQIKRTSEMSAGIMRDKERTGDWVGAEKVARQFDRLAEKAKAAIAAMPDPTALLQQAREALKRNQTALDDWLHQYAGELCREKDVEETINRIMQNGGTLAYLAENSDENRTLLAAIKEAIGDE